MHFPICSILPLMGVLSVESSNMLMSYVVRIHVKMQIAIICNAITT